MPRNPLPALVVRDADVGDITNAMRTGFAFAENVGVLVNACVAVTIGDQLVALWRTDDYPGECVWAAHGCATAAEKAVDAWCDLMIASDVPEAPRPVA
jgi:microcompartment protein CcmL/EutN